MVDLIGLRFGPINQHARVKSWFVRRQKNQLFNFPLGCNGCLLLFRVMRLPLCPLLLRVLLRVLLLLLLLRSASTPLYRAMRPPFTAVFDGPLGRTNKFFFILYVSSAAIKTLYTKLDVCNKVVRVTGGMRTGNLQNIDKQVAEDIICDPSTRVTLSPRAMTTANPAFSEHSEYRESSFSEHSEHTDYSEYSEYRASGQSLDDDWGWTKTWLII